MRKLAPKGRFLPVIGGYLYETERNGPACLISTQERADLVRQILRRLPFAVVIPVVLGVGAGALAGQALPELGANFPALLLIALTLVAGLYAALRWVMQGPMRALANRPQLSPDEARALRLGYEDSLPERPR
ncbi:hypothetical protein [Paracoccus aminophilus]|uniref:Uncharacterized protein n=1 Tax=Paracoccus aminophilus JCM 7686 TaxID=1367847 RepID=S5XQE1_PARAH|nr:hypothetical protein [Paracoccus aminophilus]AGT07272.1 hypothetical protein JCM7686_0161 [Paracoccus aminophilus JCM 7686]